MKLAVVGEVIVVYGPPLVVARFTLYVAAPVTAVHVNATCAFPGVA